MMNNEYEEDDENDFILNPPDKFNPMQKHLCTSVRFFIGGKLPVSIGPVDLSINFSVKDVIKYILTLYRKNREVQE